MKIGNKDWDKTAKEWIRKRHDYAKPAVVLVHGYAGVADNLPMGVLRDGKSYRLRWCQWMMIV